jgi:hypothetical protein
MVGRTLVLFVMPFSFSSCLRAFEVGNYEHIAPFFRVLRK